MRNLRGIAGVFALSLALALVGCGQADTNASFTVTSVPQAEMFVDGVSHGASGQTLALSAGEHKVEFKTEGFKTYATTVTINDGEAQNLEAVLEPLDPSSPIVVARLMESEGLELAPWVAPEATRGRRGKQAVAVLLWPSKDIREGGLVNFAIEADESYEGDASLEFRSGRKVLYREAFSPKSITSVRPLPAEVLEKIKVNSKITWGLYFEDSRRPIKTTFKVVRRPNAERQLQRLSTSRHMQRQPVITRAIARAVVLENNRLYSEALVANLQIANDHPQSSQPFRGIVTTLRRLEAEGSELFATVSPHVRGKGVSGISARGNGLGISAWAPVQSGALPTPADVTPSGTAKPMAPGGAGLTPSGGTQDATPQPDSPDAAAAGPSGARREADLARLDERVRSLQQAEKDIGMQLKDAEADAASQVTLAAEAATAAEQAEAAATAAREAVENAAEPTQAQLDAMEETGRAAEDAREAATVARDAERAATERLHKLQGEMENLNTLLGDAQRLLDAARGLPETPAGDPSAQGPSATELNGLLDDAQRDHDRATTEAAEAGKAVAAAEAAHHANPNDDTRAALEAAVSAHDQAQARVDEAAKDLLGARKAIEAFEQAGQPTIKK